MPATALNRAVGQPAVSDGLSERARMSVGRKTPRWVADHAADGHGAGGGCDTPLRRRSGPGMNYVATGALPIRGRFARW